jgi:hypothetical protein
MDENIISSLSGKIWITRKCRINTSERLIFADKVSQFFVNYYTLVVLSISIWTLFSENDSNNLSFITVIASLFLFGLTIGINSLDYKERIRQLKNCYIELDGLINGLDILITEIQVKDREEIKREYEKIRDTYTELLKGVENHNSYDYLKFKVTQKEHRNWIVYIHYYTLNILYIIAIAFFILFPFLPILKMFKDWI